MRKITIALMRDLEKQVNLGEISYSRMVEILNETIDSKALPEAEGTKSAEEKEETRIKIGDRIKFVQEITQDANEETPAFLFARKGDEGEIIKLKGDWKGARYSVKWDNWNTPFYAELGTDFIVLPKTNQFKSVPLLDGTKDEQLKYCHKRMAEAYNKIRELEEKLKSVPKAELPTDEEIDKASYEEAKACNLTGDSYAHLRSGFRRGAKWMRSKVEVMTKQNNT